MREIIPFQPLDAQLGVWPKQAVPEDVMDPLFGRNAAGKHVFALLDAGRIPGLLDQLDDLGLPYRSLFKGASEVEFQDVAPYLIRIDAETALTRRLFSRTGRLTDLWDRAPGIFMRSDCPLDEVRDHLRHFTRLQDEAQKWFYFRFWDPLTAARHLDTLLVRPQRYARWFRIAAQTRIDAFLIPQPSADRLIVFRPDPAFGSAADAPRLEPQDLDALRHACTERDLHQIVALMRQTFPERSAALTGAELDRLVRRSAGRAREFNIRQRQNIFRLAAWDLHAAGAFERMDPDSRLRDILERCIPEADKMSRLARRMAEIDDRP